MSRDRDTKMVGLRPGEGWEGMLWTIYGGRMLHEEQLELAKGGFTLHLLMASPARMSMPINEKLSYGLMPYTSKGSEK